MEEEIIDIEHEYSFKLTVDNVDSLAKKYNPFHKLVGGSGILPSKATKKMNNDHSDWGQGKMRGELQNLFKQCE